ncbi:hypothetical protein Dda3937_04649 [Dickeya dadantii 3937]|uniref:Uncharacterized protein n=1 Tax=Dickeya dadantii (strain 3937) TaxID=198628 RepID=E0SJH7_DICD3|nr:hypothetical protein Dda3937_04649 [Dickeya dadantii 3937]
MSVVFPLYFQAPSHPRPYKRASMSENLKYVIVLALLASRCIKQRGTRQPLWALGKVSFYLNTRYFQEPPASGTNLPLKSDVVLIHESANSNPN